MQLKFTENMRMIQKHFANVVRDTITQCWLLMLMQQHICWSAPTSLGCANATFKRSFDLFCIGQCWILVAEKHLKSSQVDAADQGGRERFCVGNFARQAGRSTLQACSSTLPDTVSDSGDAVCEGKNAMQVLHFNLPHLRHLRHLRHLLTLSEWVTHILHAF